MLSRFKLQMIHIRTANDWQSVPNRDNRYTYTYTQTLKFKNGKNFISFVKQWASGHMYGRSLTNTNKSVYYDNNTYICMYVCMYIT